MRTIHIEHINDQFNLSSSVHVDKFIGYEPRGEVAPTQGLRVKVYRNLNKPNMFSIMATEGPMKGKVLGYAPAVELCDVEFVVGQKARERLLAKKCRNVHAFAVGYLASTNIELAKSVREQWKAVTYQPYVAGNFFCRANPGVPVKTADRVWLNGADAFCHQTQ